MTKVESRPVSDPSSDPLLATPSPTLTLEEASRISREVFGIDGPLEPMRGERDQNFRVQDASGGGESYVLKIANPAEDLPVLDFQRAALSHLAVHAPELKVPSVREALDGSCWARVETAGDATYLAWMLSYLPGVPLADVRLTPSLARNLGAELARLGVGLRGFFHPAAGRVLLWDIKQVGSLRPRLDAVHDAALRRLAGRALDRFEARALPILPRLRAQVIHADANGGNVLVGSRDGAAGESVAGFIDFGDMVHTALVNDLAVLLASAVTSTADPVGDAVRIVAGYHSVTPLDGEELAVLLELWLGRLTAAVLISAWRVDLHPENAPYITADDEYSWAMIDRLSELDPGEVFEALRPATDAPSPAVESRPSSAGSGPRELQALADRRSRVLGPAYEDFYDRPLHLVRGEGTWVFDASGRRFLDAYNNVPHVGHAHPHVVEAICAQAARVNTNTRYLHESILDLAERLLATMPGALDVCMFVCTGSEANDLAWRLARAYTGASGGLVLDHAYHGNSEAVTALSPTEWRRGAHPEHVRAVPAPDDLRGVYRRGQPNLATDYAALIDAAVASLAEAGHRPAAFFCDTAYSSHGILVPPDEYLAAAFHRARQAGALCVADEVQAGFGRMGTHTWGFERSEVVPDIVTLGKPMGNGHPIAAVITRREIANALGDRGYFNTFGGNPVSAAAGLAVLDVLERERLMENALGVGRHLVARLEELARTDPVIGDVRGSGLFVGVDLVRDPGTLEPDRAAAHRVMNAMRDDGVLVGVDGPFGNVLKLRPPMPFGSAEADLLVDVLREALGRES
jgi:4-aminobutyrate aminotransferase-like enzyme/Ser/Thr protein kinase RdoA (MazF antagonist)